MLILRYKTAVKTPAGFRQVMVTAEAEPLSDKRAKVLRLVDCDGEGSSGWASRTGAKRQQYSIDYLSRHVVGQIKNRSACEEII